MGCYMLTGGKDKNVTKSIAPALLKHDRHNPDLTIAFETRLSGDDFDWAFNIVKDKIICKAFMMLQDTVRNLKHAFFIRYDLLSRLG